MRKLFSKIHLWLSVPAGIFIAVICLSGAALVFEQDVMQALHPRIYRSAPPAAGQAFLPPSELVARLRTQVPDSLQLTSLQLPGRADGVCMAQFKGTGKKTLSVNPYTGEVNGWTPTSPFFQTMRKLHRWLLNPPASRGEQSVGKMLVGVATLLMVFILLSGLVIWVPRTVRALKNRLRVSCRRGWHRFWYDSHVALGFYATLLLLLMALTGLTWSFGWYRTAAYALFGGSEQAPRQSAATEVSSARKGHGDRNGRKGADYTAWDAALTQLRQQYPRYRSITLSAGKAQIVPVSAGSMRQADTAEFDVRSGELTSLTPYADRPRSQTLRGWFYALHTGTWGGMVTKILYFLAAFIGGVLPLTGYYLWLKRRRRQRKG